MESLSLIRTLYSRPERQVFAVEFAGEGESGSCGLGHHATKLIKPDKLWTKYRGDSDWNTYKVMCIVVMYAYNNDLTHFCGCVDDFPEFTVLSE